MACFKWLLGNYFLIKAQFKIRGTFDVMALPFDF